MVAIGTSEKSSHEALVLARAHPGVVYATAGVHPNSPEVGAFSTKSVMALRALWRAPEVVAIGECGLDYCRTTNTPAAQRKAFEAQLLAAADLKKPLYLHCRDAFKDFHEMVAPFARQGLRGVVHCFTEGPREAQAFLELGLDLGVTGWASDTARGHALRDALAVIPLERLHLETDAPYLAIRTLKNRKPYNEPANVPALGEFIAGLKGVRVEKLAAHCTANSRRLFAMAAT